MRILYQCIIFYLFNLNSQIFVSSCRDFFLKKKKRSLRDSLLNIFLKQKHPQCSSHLFSLCISLYFPIFFWVTFYGVNNATVLMMFSSKSIRFWVKDHSSNLCYVTNFMLRIWPLYNDLKLILKSSCFHFMVDLRFKGKWMLLLTSHTSLCMHNSTWLWNIARGINGDEVEGRLLPKSHGTGKLFPGLRSLKTITTVSFFRSLQKNITLFLHMLLQFTLLITLFL